MSEPSSGPDLFNDLLQEFAERVRKGEHPSPTEYAARYPELAEQIRELFPALLMEECASAEDAPTAPFAVKAAAGAPAPKRLGDYRILREVGHGGMGIVYEAVQESLGRHVALKVLSLQGELSVTLLERFQREARAAARLHHTNIVPVFGIGEHAGVHYYVMQFIQGQSLDNVMREVRRLRTQATAPGCHALRGEPALAGSVAQGMLTGQFQLSEVQDGADSLKACVPPTVAKAPATIPGALNDREGSDSTIVTPSDAQYFRSVAQVGLQVAEALAYAHQQGILHRDIKPSNLLLDVQGAVWITDFGLAKSEGTDELTSPGDIVGTLRYMAPERFEGQADARSDVFSLGLTLYELATLTPAFAGSDRAQLIDRVLHQEPPRPRQIEPRIPRDLETIVLKAIAKEPRQRYAAAGEIAEDLRRFLSDRPIHARRSSAWELAWRWCRRNPAVASLTAAVALLVVGVAVGSTVSALRLNAELRRSERAEEGEKEARQATLQALWEAYRDQAEARSLSRRRGQRFEGLKAAANATRLGGDLNLSGEQLLELRNRAIACMALPDVRVAREWDGWPAESAHLDFDAALTRYVRTDRAGGVHVYRVADNTLLSSFVSSLRNPWPRLSPDGCFLTLCAASQCEIRKLDGRESAALIPVQDCVAHDVSPDSRRVALVHPDGTISVYDLASGRRLRQLKAGPHPVAFAAFHPRNKWLAVSHASGVQVRDLHTGDVRTDLPQIGAERLAWHPDGRKLAVVSSDQAIHLWDVAEHREITALRRWKNGGLRIAFNHAGDLLASYGWEHMLRLWDPRTGLEVFHTPARFTGASLRFGTDDRILAADIQDTRIRLWEIAWGQECRRLIPNPACGQVPYGPFAVHPDGRALAACTLDGFGLWDVRTGKPLASVRTEPLDSLLFEPSGALLAGGASGVFRWPFQPEAEGMMRVGSPQRLSLPRTARTQIACSLDGRVLATVDGAGGWIRDADHLDQPVPLRPHEDARAVAVSPDGRWVVTGSQHGTGARVWNARSGRLEKELLSQQGFVRVSFSPDGRWLATRGNGLRLWRVGSWQEGPFLGGIPAAGFAFSPTEKLLATETGDGILRLVDPDTGRDYARLEEPDQVRAAWICFSPDGAQLFTVGAGSGAWIRVWDLRQLRRQLADMGLDWNLPPYPPPRDPKSGLPLRVSVDPGDLPGRLIP